MWQSDRQAEMAEMGMSDVCVRWTETRRNIGSSIDCALAGQQRASAIPKGKSAADLDLSLRVARGLYDNLEF